MNRKRGVPLELSELESFLYAFGKNVTVEAIEELLKRL